MPPSSPGVLMVGLQYYCLCRHHKCAPQPVRGEQGPTAPCPRAPSLTTPTVLTAACSQSDHTNPASLCAPQVLLLLRGLRTHGAAHKDNGGGGKCLLSRERGHAGLAWGRRAVVSLPTSAGSITVSAGHRHQELP